MHTNLVVVEASVCNMLIHKNAFKNVDFPAEIFPIIGIYYLFIHLYKKIK